jgi:hypothetical protein
LWYEVVIGVVTEVDRAVVPMELKAGLFDLERAGAKIFLWDKNSTRLLLGALPPQLPRPCYEGWSYGNISNILRFLADLAGCEIAFRVDPTVFALVDPIPYTKEAINKLLDGSLLATSVPRYTHRAGTRREFVRKGNEQRFFELIRATMGIDPLNHLLGGGLMAFGVKTPPAIVLDGVMIIYSDDARYQVESPSRALPLTGYEVYRAESGHRMADAEYFVRLASAVFLHQAKLGSNARLALRHTQDFLDNLRELVHPNLRDTVKGIEAKRAIESDRILAAIANHRLLVEHWAEVKSTVAEISGGLGLEWTGAV